MFLALITQRPSELSDTCISQCANFVILRTLHPVDLKYIKEMVPNVSQEIVLQLKNLKPGNCIAFGTAFKVPTSMYIDIPNPRPLSNNVNLEAVWYELNNSGLNNGVVQQMTSNSPDSVSTIMAQQVNKANNLNMQTLSSTQQPVIQKPIQQPVQQPVPQNIQAPLPVQPQALKEITN